MKEENLKWFQIAKKVAYKKALVQHCIDVYKKPLKDHKPTQKDIEEYEKQLKSLKIKDLESISELRAYNLKLDPQDRLKSINKKKYAVMTIFNDNKTTDTGVCHCYSRSFSRSGMRYLVMSERGYYDPEFKMLHFYYFANVPYPVKFIKGKLPEASPDGKLLDDTIEFEVITALANLNISATIKLVLVITILLLVLSALNSFLLLKAAGIL